MIKKDLIKYIEENSGETESWGKLGSMKKDELEKIYGYLSKVNNFGTAIVAETGLENGEDSIEEEVEKVVRKKVDPKLMYEYVEHKTPSSLSVNEQRALLRSGRKVKKKVNKYTRFGEEEVKFGF